LPLFALTVFGIERARSWQKVRILVVGLRDVVNRIILLQAAQCPQSLRGFRCQTLRGDAHLRRWDIGSAGKLESALRAYPYADAFPANRLESTLRTRLRLHLRDCLYVSFSHGYAVPGP